MYPIYTKLKFNNKKTDNLIKKWTKDLNRYLTKEGIQIASKDMKRCSISYVSREMQFKTTIILKKTTLYKYQSGQNPNF